MAVNKNFVVKNGVEVSTDLIYAESTIDKVGIGTTTPGAKLEVIGDIIGVGLTLTGGLTGTDANYSGIVTANIGLKVGSGGTSIHVDVTNNSIGFNSTSPDTNFVLDVQPGVAQSAATLGGSLDVKGNAWINGNLKVNGAIDGSITINLNNPVITGVVTATDAEIYKQFDIINNGNIAYQFQSTGIGFTQNIDDPTLFLNRGEKYHFNVNAIGHPFYIKTTRSTGSGDQYTAGVTNDGTQVGVVTFYVPYNAPSELFYQCGAHSGMGNTMYVLKDSTSGVSTETFVTENLNVTGVATIGYVNSSGIVVTGIVTSTTFDGNLTGNVTGNVTGTAGGLTGTPNIIVSNVTAGIVTATSFNGSLTGNVTGNLIGNADTATTATNVTIADESLDTSCNVLFVTAATGNLPPKTGSNLTFNSSNGTLTATTFSGNLTGNADTATNATNITLADESVDTTCFPIFATDATGNQAPKTDVSTLTYNASNGTLSATTFSGTATNATNITLADESIDTTCFPIFATDATGNQAPKTDSSALTYNASTGQLTAVDLNATSDINLKKDIEVITDATGLIKQLNGVRFTWKENDRKSLGVIAQEIEELLPELISERTDTGTKSVNYNGLVGVLIEAVKELSARVDELEKR